MTGYWDTVPTGIWRISDPTDAKEALRDKESRFVLDKAHDRINVFGPTGKAVIIEMQSIRRYLSNQELQSFLRELRR
jgi:hypothetical protein